MNHLTSIISVELKNYDGQADRDRLLNWLQDTEANELMLTAIAREEMLLDHQYYDGQQYSEADLRVLEDRGQAPVAYNYLKSRLDWMTGTERRARVDFKVLPRTMGDEAAKDASVKTDALKYISDANNVPMERSVAFKESLIGGLSFLEVAIEDDPAREALVTRSEHWWNMIWDSCATRLDGSDMRYQMRCRNLDLDVAIAYFPDHEDALRNAAFGMNNPGGQKWYLGNPIDNLGIGDYSATAGYQWIRFDQMGWLRTNRERINIRETHFLVPVRQKVRSRGGSIFDRVHMVPYISLWTDDHLIDVRPSPYKHGRLPFIPVWCYRKAVTNAPYGVIRQQRDPQDSFNKRMSKALYAISSRRVLLEEGAIDPRIMSVEQLREEVARVDAVIQLKKGSLNEGRIKIEDGGTIAKEHVDFASRDAAFISEAFGVNSENLGNRTNAISGKAIQSRQTEGSVQTTEPFDNLHAAVQVEGMMELSNLETYYVDQRDFRLDNGQGGQRWVRINEFDPMTGDYRNDITKFQAEFALDQQPWSTTLAQAATAELWDLLKNMAPIDPAIVRSLLDLVVQHTPGLSGKDEIVKRIRAINGQRDPDAPETPEERQARDEAAREQAQMKALQLREFQLKLDKLERDGKLVEAKTVREFLTAMFSAMQGAQVAATIPGVTPIADSMMQSSGFNEQGGQDPNIPAPATPVAAPYMPRLGPPTAGTGQNQGIETVRPDSVGVQ